VVDRGPEWATSPRYSVRWGVLTAQPPPSPQRAALDRYARSYERGLALACRDFTPHIAKLWEAVVFVGRYGGQPIAEVERWPTSKVLRVASVLGRFLREEARKATIPNASGRG
jgi:hypothetical protein